MSRRRRRSGGPDGIAVVHKAAGLTSHDVVAKARGVLGTGRVGHAGTLDPDATGVLLLGVGRATRLLRFLTALPKTYAAEVVLGVETDTLDASGVETARHDMSRVDDEQIAAGVATLTGTIEQVPPMVSAVKVGGKRLHELARAGETVEREARSVTVYRFDVERHPTEPGVLSIEVECSSGTYVRTLAADLGALLGGGAHLRNLQRRQIGSFTLADAHDVEHIELLTPADGLRDYRAVTVEAELTALVATGRPLPDERLGVAGEGPWRVLDEGGRLLAVYERHTNTTTKPAVVLVGAPSK